jgi:hypothetical protein
MSHNYALCHLEAAFAATLQVKLRRCVALTLPVPLPRAGALWGEMGSDFLNEENCTFSRPGRPNPNDQLMHAMSGCCFCFLIQKTHHKVVIC